MDERREEMQSAAVLSLFCPLLQTTLNKCIAQTQINFPAIVVHFSV